MMQKAKKSVAFQGKSQREKQMFETQGHLLPAANDHAACTESPPSLHLRPPCHFFSVFFFFSPPWMHAQPVSVP